MKLRHKELCDSTKELHGSHRAPLFTPNLFFGNVGI